LRICGVMKEEDICGRKRSSGQSKKKQNKRNAGGGGKKILNSRMSGEAPSSHGRGEVEETAKWVIETKVLQQTVSTWLWKRGNSSGRMGGSANEPTGEREGPMVEKSTFHTQKKLEKVCGKQKRAGR